MSHSHEHGAHSHAHDHARTHDQEHAHDASASADSEAAHQATVVATFDSYRQASLSANQRRRADYYALPKRHRELLGDYNELLKEIDEKLLVNAAFVQQMIEQNPFPPPEDAALDAPAPTDADHDRLRSTLRQCVRDWSEAGKHERETTYSPILAALKEHFASVSDENKADVRVLVPGAGLGRLAWEVVRRGFSCQANEFSLHMLIASAYILNHAPEPNSIPIYPYLHSLSNIRSKQDLLSPCYIPDVNPNEIAGGAADFSFAAGDFLEVYGDAPGSWDACVTCFFIDTARNIVEYLETIYGLLKPGGLWINCGPTLWHFENDREASSIELPLEDVKALARKIGFEISNEREMRTCYTTNQKSLLQHQLDGMAAMIRLGSRTGITSPTSPRRCRVYSTTKASVHPTSAATNESAATNARTPTHWSPGDPIRFVSNRSTSAPPTGNVTSLTPTTANASGQGGAGTFRAHEPGWQPGQPIRFGSQPSKTRTATPSREAGMSPVKKQSRLSATSDIPSFRGERNGGPSSSSLPWVPGRWPPPDRSPPVRAPALPARLGSSNAPDSVIVHATSSTGPSRISKAELDLLVEGIDFDDDFADFMEAEASPPSPKRPTASSTPKRKMLTDDELEALVSGIDFSQDLEIDEGPATTATPSASSQCPSTAPIIRADLQQSPRRQSPAPSPEPLDHNDDSRTSSLLDLIDSPAATRTNDVSAADSPILRYRSRLPAATVEVIDLDSSYDDLEEPDQVARCAPVTLDLMESSDGEVEIVSRRRRPAADPVVDKNDASISAVPGFFARPEGLARPQNASVPTTARAQASAGSMTPREAARLKKSEKATEDARRQADFRKKWPRTFSYKKWHKDVRVVYTANEIVVERELRAMSGPLGFDLEWDSYSGYRTQGKTALAQVSDEKTVLLVHVAKMRRFPPALKELVEDPHRIKLGVQIAGDGNKLKRDFAFEPRGLLDLNACVHHYDPSRYHGRQRRGLIGLQELTGIYLDRFLPKDHTVRTSRWSAVLGQEQKDYAANDVYATVQIVRHLQALAEVSSEQAENDLAMLSRRAFSPWTGFGPSAGARPPASRSTKTPAMTVQVAAGEHSTVRTSPDQVLSPRRFQAFSLFHRQELRLAEVTARMSETKTVKPVTVVWNLLSAFAALAEHRIDIAWDVERLVAAMDDIGDWPERMVAEHGELAATLRERSTSN